jgi:signal transduction histidine kinase/CHASE3 domain sensor protein
MRFISRLEPRTLRNQLRVAFAFFLAVIVVSGASSLVALVRAHSAAHAVAHDGARLVEANASILQAMTNAQTALRGFALSGDDTLLAPYDAGREQYADALRRARELGSDHAPIQRAIAEESRLADIWFAQVASDLRTGAYDVTRGDVLFTRFREAHAAGTAAMQEHREADDAAAEHAVRTSMAVLTVWCAAGLAVGFMVSRRTVRRTSTSLAGVQDALASLAAGDLQVRAAEDGPEEMSAVARAVNGLGEVLERLTKEQRDRFHDEQAIRHASRSMRKTLEVEAVATHATAAAGELLCTASVLFARRAGDQWTLEAAWHFDPACPFAALTDLPASFGAVATAAGDDRRARTSGRTRDQFVDADRAATNALAAELGAGSMLLVPVANGTLQGALVALSDRERTWSPHDVYLAEALAREASAAVITAVAYEREREMVQLLTTLDEAQQDRIQRDDLLTEVARVAHADLDVDKIVARSVAALGPRLDVDIAMLRLHDGTGVSRRAGVWCSPGTEAPPLYAAGAAKFVLDQASAAGRTVFVTDVDVDDRLPPEARVALGSLGCRSMLAVPLAAGGTPIGVLELAAREPREWRAEDVDLLERIGREIDTALRHAQAYATERELVNGLQELERTRADFVASVSHELRSPLASILGYVELLGDGDAGRLTVEQAQMVTVVERNGRRLLGQVEDLLTLSRIGAGTFSLQVEPADVALLAERAVEAVRPRARSAQLSMSIDVAPDVPALEADTVQLERVLSNLLVNAVKFTPTGGSIEISIRAAGNGVRVAVSDTGIGIPEAEQPALFDRFFRASNAQASGIEGTGLGLFIAKTVVERHGGVIGVESAIGAGTTFWFTLPRVARTAERSLVPRLHSREET